MNTALLLSLLAACAPDTADTADTADTVDTLDTLDTLEVDIDITTDALHPLGATVAWSGPAATAGQLEVRCDADVDVSFDDPAARVLHQVFVMGLVADAACTATATVTDAAGATGTATADWTVPGLPDWVPVLDGIEADPSRIAPGMTLINLRSQAEPHPMVVAVVDAQGRYRWFDDQLTTDPGLDNVTRITPEGILVGGQYAAFWPSLIGWRGEVLWQAEGVVMHHEITPTDAGTFLVLGKADPEGCPDKRSTDVVEEVDAAGAVVWQWRICEHYQPAVITEDWDHLNAIVDLPDQDAILVSSRHQNAVFLVDRPTGEVVWKLGEDGSFDLPESARFYNNHSPEVLPNGNVLLFDNGDDQRPYSRLLELAVDVGAGTAREVWSYRPTPDIYSWAWGDADRLENGNTLGTFGHVLEGAQAEVIEAAADGAAVWRLRYPAGWGSYRADRVTLPEGFVIDDDGELIIP